MKFSHVLTLALGAALLLPLTRALAADNPTTAPAAMTQPFNVGTASIQKIYDNLEEAKQIKASMDDQRKGVQLQADKMQDDIKNLTADLSVIKKDSPGYAAKNDELVNAKIKYEVFVQTNNSSFDRLYKVQYVRMFTKIQDAINEVAKQQGYNLIINIVAPTMPADSDLDNITLTQLSYLMDQRTVLFVDPDGKHDISHDVWVQMNADFAKSK